MKKWFLFLCLSAISLMMPLVAAEAPAATHEKPTEFYKAKDFSYLLGMKGFTDQMLQMHFKLYQGYVTNTNLLLSILNQYAADGKESTPQFAEIKRRLGWEFDGMRLHEAYFGVLGGPGGDLSSDSPLHQRIVKDFGSYEKWKQDFIATGLMRGIGWVILTLDPIQNRLINVWVGEHDRGLLAGGEPILVMDVWEHAYILDYGLNRKDYIQSFFNNVDWDAIKKKYNPPVS